MEYTVTNRHGEVQCRSAGLNEAADTVMFYDGHEYEVRLEPDKRGWRLWTSQFSLNAPGGGRPLVKSVIFSLDRAYRVARADIFAQVLTHADWWNGCQVYQDHEYDAMIAAAKAEQAEADAA